MTAGRSPSFRPSSYLLHGTSSVPDPMSQTSMEMILAQLRTMQAHINDLQVAVSQPLSKIKAPSRHHADRRPCSPFPPLKRQIHVFSSSSDEEPFPAAALAVPISTATLHATMVTSEDWEQRWLLLLCMFTQKAESCSRPLFPAPAWAPEELSSYFSSSDDVPSPPPAPPLGELESASVTSPVEVLSSAWQDSSPSQSLLLPQMTQALGRPPPP